MEMLDMSKEEWKKTGKELGGAFEGLAKTLIRSASAGIDKAEEWAERDENAPKQADPQEERNVFNDGSWRETGKELGSALKGLGATLINTGSETVDKAEDWAERKVDNNDDPPQQ